MGAVVRGRHDNNSEDDPTFEHELADCCCVRRNLQAVEVPEPVRTFLLVGSTSNRMVSMQPLFCCDVFKLQIICDATYTTIRY